MNTEEFDDYTYGTNKENVIINILSQHYNLTNLKHTNKWNQFDFIDTCDKIVFELKSRRNKKDQYYDTMIGANKIKKGLELCGDGYRVYFCFCFTDFLCIYQLTPQSINPMWYRSGGRWDRTSPEIKNYCFIPNKLLTKLYSLSSQGKFQRVC